MIGSLRGKILEKNPPAVLIEVSGIGFEVIMPMTSIYELPPIGSESFVYTDFIVREDAETLYGFTDSESRNLFREIIKVSGIGPKTALAVLSAMTSAEFISIINSGDPKPLIKIPGIGKKTAERTVLELKDSLIQKLNANSVKMPEHKTSATKISDKELSDIKIQEEASSALISLGYKPQQASMMVEKAWTDGMNTEDLIKEALKKI